MITAQTCNVNVTVKLLISCG